MGWVMEQFKNLKIAMKLTILVGIALVGLLIFGYFANSSMQYIEVNGPVFQSISTGKDLVADILPPPEYIIETHLTSFQLFSAIQGNTDTAQIQTLLNKVDQLHKDFQDRAAYWEKTLPEGDLKNELVDTAIPAGEKYYDAMYAQFIPAVQKGDAASAEKVLDNTLTPLYEQHRQSINRVVQMGNDYNQQLVDSAAKTISQTQVQMILILVIAAVLVAGVGLFISTGIVRPVREMVGVARAISSGDVSQEVTYRANDEMGQLANAFRAMIGYLQAIAGAATGMAARDLSHSVPLASSKDVLGVAFNEMTGNLRDAVQSVMQSASTLASASNTLEGKANSVASSTDQMSANTVSVAASMEQAATNLRSVATATEEMTATIGEISHNSDQARRITEQAVEQTARVTRAFQDLSNSAQKIGAVTETINSISRQTNLLALNATIEAARAGAAGKGFAVVATEVKDLALQTSAATEDIKTKVDSVQRSSAAALADIQTVGQVIGEISQIVTSIATAIEEQSVVTRDIASNIAQATTGVDDANQRVSQTANLVTSVTRDITGGSLGLADSSSVLASIHELSALAGHLQEVVSLFQV
jgi:methyl-accepting chemotaxis protein